VIAGGGTIGASAGAALPLALALSELRQLAILVLAALIGLPMPR
jgi:hypothetical protein